MKKNILNITAVLLSIIAYGQVGVDTAYPKALFHVDAGKDNPKNSTSTISNTQVSNDVTITKDGSVGIGVIAPDVKLHIDNGTTNGAVKIVDGTQGENKVLMSDAEGVGTWQTLNSLKAVVPGVFPSAVMSVTGDGTKNSFGATKYSQTYVDLTPGRWIVNIGLTIRSTQEVLNRFWMHAYLSTSTTSIVNDGFMHLGPAGNNTSYAGIIFGNPARANNSYTSNGTNMLSGSSLINVTKNTRIYLLLDDANSLATQNGEKVGTYVFSTGSWENYFYAIPIE